MQFKAFSTVIVLWFALQLNPALLAQTEPVATPIGEKEIFGGYAYLSNSFNSHTGFRGPGLNGWEHGRHEAAQHLRVDDGPRDLTGLLGDETPPDSVALGPQIFAFVVEALAVLIHHNAERHRIQARDDAAVELRRAAVDGHRVALASIANRFRAGPPEAEAEIILKELAVLKKFAAAARSLQRGESDPAKLPPAIEADRTVIPNYFVLKVGGWRGYYRIDLDAMVAVGVLALHKSHDLRGTLKDALHEALKKLPDGPKKP